MLDQKTIYINLISFLSASSYTVAITKYVRTFALILPNCSRGRVPISQAFERV